MPELSKEPKEAKVVPIEGTPKKPAQQWADLIHSTIAKAIAPMGFKKHKSGRIVARLDMLTRERIQFAGQSMCNLTNHHMNLILTDLNEKADECTKIIEELEEEKKGIKVLIWLRSELQQMIDQAKATREAYQKAFDIVMNTPPKTM